MASRTGARRGWVDEVMKRVCLGRPPGELDPYSLWTTLEMIDVDTARGALRPPLASARVPDDARLGPALRMAALVLLHEELPGYPALMYLNFLLSQAGTDSPLGRWGVDQLATMLLSGSEAVQASADYLIGVSLIGSRDLEHGTFSRLVTVLPREKQKYLLSLSPGVTWQTKRPFLEKMAEDRALHGDLARALQSACTSGYLGRSDGGGVLALLSRLDIDDGLRAQVTAAATGPVRATALAALVPEGRGPLAHPGRYLLRLDFHTPVFTWLEGSELRCEKRGLGRFAQFRSFYEKGAEIHGKGPGLLADPFRGYRRLWTEPAAPTSDGELVRWHAIDGPPEEAPRLLGQRVEFWPDLRASYPAAPEI